MTNEAADQGPVVQIDIISDVMCPWCIVGFRQLEQALAQTQMGARVRWHPFELNPNMPPEGQNLTEHIAEKYGATPEQSAKNRAHLVALGQSLGIDFQFTPESRIVNTFLAHQLLDFALSTGMQHPLKMALFQAHFSEGRDVSDIDVLVDVAASIRIDAKQARQVLENGSHANSTREKQTFWTQQGISGVPAMVFEEKYLLTGAQGADNYAQLLRRCATEQAA